VLSEVGSGEPTVDEHTRKVDVLVDGGTKALIEALRRLDAQGVVVQDIALHRPTLDDVFLSLTGHTSQEGEE
jgi:ABC-2 type transport system ATP-binding protein